MSLSKLDKDFIALENKIYRLGKAREKTIAKNYKNTLDSLRITLARMYEKYEIDGQLTYSEMIKYNRLQKLDKEVQNLITKLYVANSKVIRGTLKGIIEDTYTNSIGIVNKHTSSRIKSIKKDVGTSKIINNDMAGLVWTERLKHGRGRAIYEVQKEVKQGLYQGDTYRTMTKRLKDKLDGDVYKTNRILRTEGHRCLASAKEESFEKISKAGIEFRKKYLSSNDERTREMHSALHGVIVDSDKPFIYQDGVETMQPGLSGASQHDINCRCVASLVIE